MKAGFTRVCWPVLFSAALLAPTVSPAQPLPPGWDTYVNVRYGFQVCYPKDLFRPHGEPDNSDGQTLTARDGARLLVFGSNNVLAQSLPDRVRELVKDAGGAQARVTYHVTRPGWDVSSGSNGGDRIFYIKVFEREDQFIVLDLTYKAADQARYGPIAARMSRCFRTDPQHF